MPGCSLWRLRTLSALLLSAVLAGFPSRPVLAHSIDGAGSASKNRLTDEQIGRENWIRHLARAARASAAAKGNTADAAAVRSTDVNDMTVLEGNNNTVIRQNPFDLNSTRVTFTPSGTTSYVISSSSSPANFSLGTKLDFTGGSAVNPKRPAEPGDDAYIMAGLGFAFPFYGSTYSDVGITTNGNVVFRPPNIPQKTFDDYAVESGESFTNLRDELPRIAPYWHDLDARTISTPGANGIYYRTESDRAVITYFQIHDFRNTAGDTGTHRFQITLYRDGRIEFAYDSAQLTSTAMAGITPGAPTAGTPVLADFSRPATAPIDGPIAELFSTSTTIDEFAVIDDFYAAHGDAYDFLYIITDFDSALIGDAFAYYVNLRNAITGIGRDPSADSGPPFATAARIQGFINLANIARYPSLPTTRFLFANSALSIFGQEQGHRWGIYIKAPGANPNILLGRDNAHWSFFANAESNVSRPAARRSSSMEGNTWVDNGDGSFTSVNLVDGYSRWDHYLMGLRPPPQVPDMWVIANPTDTNATPSTSPKPAVTVRGTRTNININDVIQANGPRVPDAASAPKSFRAAWVLVTMPGAQASSATLGKLLRYRLAWESYFAQATDYLASLNAGLSESNISRTISAVSAADYSPVAAPGAIASIFGTELTAGATEAAASGDLPMTLAGIQVMVDGIPTKLFLASPGQINFQIPLGAVAVTRSLGVNSATSLVEVLRNGELVRAGTIQTTPVSPAVFTADATGTGPAAALDAVAFQPAPFAAKMQTGTPNIIAVFGTGAGVDATDVDGDQSSLFQAAIDGAPATVTYAGRAPGFPGLNQFNVVLPANVTSGSHSLTISRNGIASGTVTLLIR
jgi:uncharacterized protein (TIGR03437 family)